MPEPLDPNLAEYLYGQGAGSGLTLEEEAAAKRVLESRIREAAAQKYQELAPARNRQERGASEFRDTSFQARPYLHSPEERAAQELASIQNRIGWAARAGILAAEKPPVQQLPAIDVSGPPSFEIRNADGTVSTIEAPTDEHQNPLTGEPLTPGQERYRERFGRPALTEFLKMSQEENNQAERQRDLAAYFREHSGVSPRWTERYSSPTGPTEERRKQLDTTGKIVDVPTESVPIRTLPTYYDQGSGDSELRRVLDELVAPPYDAVDYRNPQIKKL